MATNNSRIIIKTMSNSEKYAQVPLSQSLRKYIRQKKAEIRREHGTDSEKYKEFMEWVQEKRKEKAQRVSSTAK